ncbi:response regulator [Adhaeribacter aquaticus]|uniref:response regulator n=1 Tax=Adhaeribacter aquaticus TaxID=299567 RepID=UPI0004037B40|nr:response regulator [Adhaeribacter aquaticus]
MYFIKLVDSFNNWLNRLSIATKVTLVFSILVLVATTVVGFLVFSGNSKLVIASSKDRLKHSSEILSIQLDAAAKGLHNDIRLISKNPVFQDFVQEVAKRGTQPVADAKRKQVNQLFQSLLESRPAYLQVSLIGAGSSKREIIRTDQVNGKINEVPVPQLGTLEGTLFFNEVPDLTPNRVFISNLSLFRKKGELSFPLTPVIKASLPVYDANQEIVGVLLITLDLTPTFKNLQSLLDHENTLYLTNNTGDYLIHPEPDKVFGFEKGQRFLLQNEFPQSTEVIYGGKSSFQFDEALQGNQEPVLLNLERVYIFQDQERFLVLGISTPYSSLLAGLKQVRNTSLLITLVICIGSIVLTLVFSRFLIRPLQYITTAVSDFAAGKSTLKVTQNRSDEIGVLAQAFSQMADQIQDQIQELAYKERGIRAIIETTIEAIIILDKQGRVEKFNPAATSIFGYQAAQIVGKPISTILNSPAENQLWNGDGTGSYLNFIGQGRETTAVREDGKQIHIYLSLSSFDAGDEIKYTAIIHDITARKQVEEELLQAKQLAEEANIAKDDFLSVMSHEIRTPMNAVIGMSRLLLQNKPGAHQLPIINTLRFSADNLMSLINDILDYSKIQAGKIEFEEVDFNLKELLDKITLSHQAKCQEKGIQLYCQVAAQVPDRVKGDSVRLYQILNNLIGNAVKFTESGTVTVNVFPDGELPGYIYNLCFEIADTGIGIAPDSQAYIFERFTQGSSDTTRKYGGSGLGLAITKNLVELQGGEISLDSTLGKGSVFKVYLSFKPASAMPVMRKTYNQETSSQLRGLQVLYVEDVAFNQFLIQNYLAKSGIELDLADSGLKAIAKVTEKKYDLILMDIQMPEMDGFQATQEIRKLDKNVPILALTALVSDKAKARMQEVGLNDYLLKPVEQEDLLNKIAAYTVKEIFAPQEKQKVEKVAKRVGIINYQTLEEAYDHDPVKIEKALLLIQGEMMQYRHLFREALAENNKDLFKSSFHKIKPHLQLLQLEVLTTNLAAVKLYLLEGQGDQEMLGQELEVNFERLLEEIKERLTLIVASVDPS